ncbi:MBOAT family O-acyltransferase [Chitinophaga sp. LS1]|nr:MBOAT family O-acyltransferase [Chitinophaga sp. LS1]WPV64466.1 MBOAT family O-acyltransferase [Chitinophaga sp. LS1]
MVFNSINFLYFILIFFPLYFLLSRKLKLQNYLILLASLFFYACWDYRFLTLLLANVCMDYYFGIAIYNAQDPGSKKRLLNTAVIMNIGILFFFKYFNFFIQSFNDFTHIQLSSLNILLPIGISFYTFHSLSYTIDIYHNKLAPTRDFVAYASFVTFFPQLVAGPISRAKDMLPKLTTKREIDAERMSSGLSQITQGFFKKMVIADTIATFVDPVFNNLPMVSDLSILLAVIFYSFQIYCDFSGYTDIAQGLGRIFGIELKVNFNRPYFSKNFSEFWERWHISLSSWLRDYLYIPLGGNRKGTVRTYINLFITMLLGGLWHGASYNFIIWGALHGIYLIIQRLFKFKLPGLIAIFITFGITTLTWIFFRAQTLHDAMYILQRIFTLHNKQLTSVFTVIKLFYLTGTLLVLDLLIVNYFEKVNRKALIINIVLLVHILLFSTFSGNSFIYFQF